MSQPTPNACEDRPRECKRAKPYLVEAGNYDGAHSIGMRSCAFHLADTAENAARCAQPVRVINADTATREQMRDFRLARGGPWADRILAEIEVAS